jgi:hypothetical protein
MVGRKREISDAQIAFITTQRDLGYEWDDITDRLNAKFGTDKTSNAVRHAYRAYGPETLGDSKGELKVLQDTVRIRMAAAHTKRTNDTILKALNIHEDLLARIDALLAKRKLPQVKPAKPLTPQRDRPHMTMELLASDIHVGKKTKTFNHEVCISRFRQLVRATLGEMKRNSQLYNLDRLIVGLLGDLIENFEMHGIESARNCEFGTAMQVERAIDVLFNELLVPLYKFGIKLTVVCIAGNHDRGTEKRSMTDIGETYLTWVIYQTLAKLCAASGMTNIEFHIPAGPYHVEDIYGTNCCYEHGDLTAGPTRTALESMMAKRQAQSKKVLHYYRIGHYHDATVFGQGKIIVNGSVPGQDGYAESLGFDSQANQILSEYIQTDTRPNCFFRAFPIYLE